MIEVGTPKKHKKRTVAFPKFLGEHLARQCSAAMTLDTYADLFDGDPDAVSDALDHAVSLANVPKICPAA